MSDEIKRGPGRPPKIETVEPVAVEEPTVLATVLRDYWTKADEDGGRVRAGSVIAVTKDDLIAGMEKGLLQRAD